MSVKCYNNQALRRAFGKMQRVAVKIAECVLQRQLHHGVFGAIVYCQNAVGGVRLRSRKMPACGRAGRGLAERSHPLAFARHFACLQQVAVGRDADAVLREFVFRGEDAAAQGFGRLGQVRVVLGVFVGTS